MREGLRIWARVMTLGCMWAAGSVGFATTTMGAANPQEPAAPSEKVQSKKDHPGEEKDGKKSETQRKPDTDPVPPSSSYGLKDLGKDFLGDQKQIWTSPARLRFADADWLVPASGFAAGLFVTDRDVSTHLSNDPKTISHNKTYSDVGAAMLIGGAGAMWLLSHPAHREHWRETGFLAGEAGMNSLVAVEALKYTMGRKRPFQGDGNGPFFSGGTSFPSEHAAAAWAVAGVIAHEYPGPIPKILAYGLASFVSYSRIRARQHFPSDVFIGSMMGQMIAQDVYSRHSDASLGGGEWKPIRDFLRVEGNSSPSNQGSPYVPLDSWIYEALDRLAGLGVVDSEFAAMRPWTRGECARLVNEAVDRGAGADPQGSETGRLVEELQKEFRAENEGDGSVAFRVESVYSRTEHISGLPLTDGYHFGQTRINDFGRPYGQGWNTVNGASTYATWGRWVGYLRGEWQTAPGAPALSLTARQSIEKQDLLTLLPPDTAKPSTSQFELLDAYVGIMLSNWQFTFGRQSLWWGPGSGGPLMFSDNAAPINMFRINRVSPFKLPSILGWLGPLRLEVFLGQVRGDHFIFGVPTGHLGNFTTKINPQPMIEGERFTFKPTKDFEFGFSVTAMFAGEGVPFTLHSYREALLSSGNGLPGTAADPGDRRSGMDWSYRLPKFRDWLTFYGDAFTDDQISPIAYLDRSAIRGGLFLARVPYLPKLDLRIEGVYTDLPIGGNVSNGFFYHNSRFLDGYTNEGNLLASWIGREAQGTQAWANYWFNSRNRVQFNFRHQKVSQQYLPGGATLTDVGARGDYWIKPTVSLSATVQYERWLFPVIQPNASTNVSASVEILFQPQKLFRGATGSGVGGTQP